MTESKSNLSLLVVTYLLMIIVVFVLPFFSIEGYSILRNTTSHLGAQNTPNAWLMNAVFILLGVMSLLVGWPYLGKYLFHKIVLSVFAASLIGAAFYHHAPIDPSLPSDLQEDQMHSFFATLTGFSFCLFAVSTAFVSRARNQQLLAVIVAVMAMGLSILMFNPYTQEWKGVWQRIIFISSFAWLIYYFSEERLSD